MSYTKVSENKYRIFISSGTNLDGSRRRYSKTITTSLKGKDLDKFLTLAEYDFEDEIKASNTNYNNMANNTFSNYVEWWLSYADLTEQTRESYKYNLRFIEKHIGHKTLSRISKADMLELLKIIKLKKNANSGKAISERTIRNYMNILKALFRDAVDLEILSTNPMSNIKFAIKEYQLEDNYYDVEDINEMIFALDNEIIEYQFAVLFTLATGLRLGELLALQECDFDYTTNSVKISKSLSGKPKSPYLRAIVIHPQNAGNPAVPGAFRIQLVVWQTIYFSLKNLSAPACNLIPIPSRAVVF